MRTMSRRADSENRNAKLELVPGPTPVADSRVRPDRIAQARERIRQRYYERTDVRRALIEALLVEFAAPEGSR
jgi:hypothetical protein